MATERDILIESLNDPDPTRRRLALEALAETPPTGGACTPLHVNMHCHTFFSYNGYGASPARVAWEGYDAGWYAGAICDFDVLDGLDEFTASTDLLELRAAVHMETRVFFDDYADQEINSPGEPGVYYFMGAGFTSPPDADSDAARELESLRRNSEVRNRQVLARINAHLSTVTLDYDTDILPMVPFGNATERHMVMAYYLKVREVLEDTAERVGFWSAALGTDADTVAAQEDDAMVFSDLLRSKLMKMGGPGYVPPTADTFPPIQDIIDLVTACKAIPMGTWLDGTRAGESDIEAQLECLMAKGVAALNIIPDRNWNLPDGDERNAKIRHFHECVAVADRLALPLNIGTELNKFGQPWVDDFSAGPMQEVAGSFIQGATVMVGHTRFLRFAGVSYCGPEMAAEFGTDRHGKNALFAAAGALPAPDSAMRVRLAQASPEVNYGVIRDAARIGAW